MGKILTLILIAITVTSCAFDGPSRPDIPVLDNIVLESGPGASGKYTLAKREPLGSGHSYSPLTDNDSVVKIIVSNNVVFVETMEFDKSPKFYRFESDSTAVQKNEIKQKEFANATSKCGNCKQIVVPKDERP